MKNRIIPAFACAAALAVPVAVLTGCYKTEAPQTVGQVVDDKTIEAQVHGALADSPSYKFDDVKVAVSGGTVQLSGFVNTDDQKSKAAEIARNVSGVKDVQNNISLKPAAP